MYNRKNILKFLIDEDVEHYNWERDIKTCKEYNSKETLEYIIELNPYDKEIGKHLFFDPPPKKEIKIPIETRILEVYNIAKVLSNRLIVNDF